MTARRPSAGQGLPARGHRASQAPDGVPAEWRDIRHRWRPEDKETLDAEQSRG